MLWEGNRQIQEYTDHHIFTTVYDQDSFEPVVRIVQARNPKQDNGQGNGNGNDEVELFKIYHYHNNHLGTPQELTDENGEVVWANYEFAWGGSYQRYYKEQSLNDFAIQDYQLQPIKFQGQSLDIETGLHYNRFRYYDSDVGMFISRDPIGLLGGYNIFQYAPNPIHWVDVLGLSGDCNAVKEQIYNKHLLGIKSRIATHNYTNRPNAKLKISGGVSGAIGYTKATGILVGGSDHIQKGRDLLKGLKDILKAVDNSHSLCDSDKKRLHALADPYVKKLQNALALPIKVQPNGKTT